jgi:hypothetical protein
MLRFALFFAAMLPVVATEPPGHLRQQAGKYEVVLRPQPGGLYAGEEMQIELRISDASQPDPLLGNPPVVRANVMAVVDMPRMQGMPKIMELAHPESVSGDYGVHPTFAHGGEYRLALSVAPVGDAPFTVEFPLQVADADPSRHRKAVPPAYFLEVISTPRYPKAGEPVELQLLVHHRDYPKDTVTLFDLQHERYLHLVIVRNDLCCFSHLHPEQVVAKDGFRIQHIFMQGGEYHLFADVAPHSAGSQLLSATLKVAGAAGERYSIASAPETRTQVVEGVRFEIEPSATPASAGKTCLLTVRITDAAGGTPLSGWEPYLGAMGHLMGVGAGALTFVHAHPDGQQVFRPEDGKIAFLVRFPSAGPYRAWVQIQRNGKVLTADFPLSIQP